MIPLAPTSKIVGLTSTLILGINSRRVRVYLSNESDAYQKIFLSYTSPALLNAGICIRPGGIINLDETDQNLPSLCLYGISDCTDANITIQEFEE